MGQWKSTLGLLIWAFVLLLASDMPSGSEEFEEDTTLETVEEDDAGMHIQFADGPDMPNLFKPTKEWQKVNPGQPIPRGLHIRYNLQTGYTEAKLLDETEPRNEEASEKASPTSLSLTPVEEERTDEEPTVDTSRGSQQSHMKSMLEQAVRDMEKEEKVSKKESLKYWSDGTKQVMEGRCAEQVPQLLYGDLKKEMEEMEMGMKTETEIIRELMESYRNPDISVERKVSILTDLEFYLHQIDNAQNFVTMGGLPLLLQDLNSTEDTLRQEAAFVLGSATQSNPHVQVECLEAGVLPQLIRMMSVAPSTTVRGRVLYATSTLIRHFPFAQHKFLEQGGLYALSQVLSETDNHKIKIKTVTLLTDLLLEQNNALENLNQSDASQATKLQQYEKIPWRVYLREQSWCKLIPSLLQTTEHDAQEKVLTAMLTLIETCHADFSQPEAQAVLSQLQLKFKVLSQEEITSGDNDEYFRELLNHVDSLIHLLTRHDEL